MLLHLFSLFQSETEWQHFLRECLETIAKVAELLPEDTLQMLVGAALYTKYYLYNKKN